MKMYNPPHPGEILKREFLEPLDMSQSELARRIGCSRSAINRIVTGRDGISMKMAYALSREFNTTPELWLNMQQAYDVYHYLNTVANKTQGEIK